MGLPVVPAVAAAVTESFPPLLELLDALAAAAAIAAGIFGGLVSWGLGRFIIDLVLVRLCLLLLLWC